MTMSVSSWQGLLEPVNIHTFCVFITLRIIKKKKRIISVLLSISFCCSFVFFLSLFLNKLQWKKLTVITVFLLLNSIRKGHLGDDCTQSFGPFKNSPVLESDVVYEEGSNFTQLAEEKTAT